MVSLKDPITNEEIKKYGKNFLVENIIRLLEEGLFKFPVEDERLRQQLLNYRVLRRNAATSKPVYGMHNEHIGDHRLDACMLSLGALVLEESVYNGKSNFISAPTYIKKNIHQQNENTESIIEQYQKAKFGGDINVLNLTRPGLEPDEVKHKPNSSRDLIPKKEFSILEALNNNKTNPNQPLITGHQRRGRFGSKNRSWQ
jgi:hypothetical protein